MIPPPLLRRVRLSVVALVAVLGLAGYRALRPVAPASVAPPHGSSRIGLTDLPPYGANFFLEREVEAWKQEKTVQMAAQAGLRWAKQQFLWSEIEPERGVYNWEKYDRLVALYRRYGIEVIARVDWPPAWVEPAAWVRPALRGVSNAPPADPDVYGAFVAALVDHYRPMDKSGKPGVCCVRFFQVWNEPNLRIEWGDNRAHPVNAAEYVALLQAAAVQARALEPLGVVILSAPLAINLETPELEGNQSDLAYLEAMYEAGAAPYFDVLSANAFGMDRPPEDPPAPGTLNFRRVELQRAIMERHDDADKPVWFNEYGWNAAPPGVESIWERVTEAQQAAWTVDGVRWAAEHWPWAGVFSIWYFRLWGEKTPADADYYFRMVDVLFTPRRLYDAVQSAAMAPAVAGPGVWAERSPAVRLAQLDDWSWERADGADDDYVLVGKNAATLDLSFEGAAVAVRVRTGTDGAGARAVVDGTGSGRLASFQSAAPTWQWVTLAEGLGGGRHHVRLVVVGDGQAMIDSFRVDAGTGLAVDAWLWGLAALALGLVLLLLADLGRVARRIRL